MSTNDKKLSRKPFALIIRDGWGHNPNTAEDAVNTIKQANTPIDDMLMKDYPNCLVNTCGESLVFLCCCAPPYSHQDTVMEKS